jgi:hypothetical protein
MRIENSDNQADIYTLQKALIMSLKEPAITTSRKRKGRKRRKKGRKRNPHE